MFEIYMISKNDKNQFRLLRLLKTSRLNYSSGETKLSRVIYDFYSILLYDFALFCYFANSY
jgi:hypothetical protein